MHTCSSTNLSEKNKKTLRELKYREDNVTANTDKGRELVVVDVKDCIKNPKYI